MKKEIGEDFKLSVIWCTIGETDIGSRRSLVHAKVHNQGEPVE